MLRNNFFCICYDSIILSNGCNSQAKWLVTSDDRKVLNYESRYYKLENKLDKKIYSMFCIYSI